MKVNTRPLTTDERIALDALFDRCNLKCRKAFETMTTNTKLAWALLDEAISEEREGMNQMEVTATLQGYRKSVK